MGVPPDISKAATEPRSSIMDEAYNSKGPETKVPGQAQQLSNNPGGLKKGTGSSQSFNAVEAEGNDLVHSDGKTAQKAIELLRKYKDMEKPFFLAVGFVRPHVPLVAPKKYFEPYPLGKMALPPKIPGDQDDIPQNSGNRRTTANYQMDLNQQKGTLRAYYASVSFVDALVGKILTALEATGQQDDTIVIFTSDHGYHLGEHDLWQKVSIHEESAKVPLIIRVPGKKPAVCHSLSELIDLYPTVSPVVWLENTRQPSGEGHFGNAGRPCRQGPRCRPVQWQRQAAPYRKVGFCSTTERRGTLRTWRKTPDNTTTYSTILITRRCFQT